MTAVELLRKLVAGSYVVPGMNHGFLSVARTLLSACVQRISCLRGQECPRHACPLPANTFVLLRAFGTLRAIKVDQINYDLFRPQVLRQPLFARRLIAENHNLGRTHHAFKIGCQHRSNVRNHLFYVLAIRAREPARAKHLRPTRELQAPHPRAA